MSTLLILLAPLLGGLLYGFERVVRARMQGRQGPPLLQPFYDMFKLMDKRTLIVHAPHALLAVAHFAVLWLALAALLLGANLLYAIFLHLFALILLVLAGYSVRSPYSHLGANRELLALVAYEPVLILVAVGFYLVSGSFDGAAILQSAQTPLWQMPLLFAALLLIIPVKLKKSPFDAVDGHQEIVGGVEVEYGGLFYEFLYAARFLEYAFVYTLVYYFGGGSIVIGLALAALVFLGVNLVDNATARVRPAHMVRIVSITAGSLALLNLFWMSL